MKNDKNAIKGFVAFWRHSDFPHLLGGHTTRMDEYGCVETIEFGSGAWFRPEFLLPEAQGESLLAKLKALSREHRAAEEAFRIEWLKKASELVEKRGR